MQRSMWRSKLIFLMAVVLSLSGLFLGTAQASDPTQLEQFLRTNSCPKCDLTEANLLGLGMAKADLRGAFLGSANLYRANLLEADLTGADLTGADLSGANLKDAKGVDFTNAKTNLQTICPNGSNGPCQ